MIALLMRLVAGTALMLLVVVLALLFDGADRIISARMQRRLGPPLLQPFLDLLKLDATLVNVGAVEPLDKAGLNGMAMAFGRKSLAGSVIGGIAETQQMIDYCGARGITADIELIPPAKINEAFDRVVNKDIRYRFVIDVKAARA